MYASFQHDVSAVPAVEAMGYRNVMWGDDYPHLEGTYGHTQETLHDLFDDADADTVRTRHHRELRAALRRACTRRRLTRHGDAHRCSAVGVSRRRRGGAATPA